jgi:hypothetical protein
MNQESGIKKYTKIKFMKIRNTHFRYANSFCKVTTVLFYSSFVRSVSLNFASKAVPALQFEPFPAGRAGRTAAETKQMSDSFCS